MNPTTIISRKIDDQLDGSRVINYDSFLIDFFLLLSLRNDFGIFILTKYYCLWWLFCRIMDLNQSIVKSYRQMIVT